MEHKKTKQPVRQIKQITGYQNGNVLEITSASRRTSKMLRVLFS